VAKFFPRRRYHFPFFFSGRAGGPLKREPGFLISAHKNGGTKKLPGKRRFPVAMYDKYAFLPTSLYSLIFIKVLLFFIYATQNKKNKE
jgi:hypothetical protein